MKALVLAYHSHDVAGEAYAGNDHVALARDLRAIHAAGARIVPLGDIARALEAGLAGHPDETWVGLSFDDGPSFDHSDFEHPRHGRQRGFLGILRDFRSEVGAAAQPRLHATSFVIASPAARAAMERAEDCGYPHMPGWLTDAWWGEAAASGLLGIGNHSWDHVHHAVPEVAVSRPERDDFSIVDNYADADRQIRRAGEFINARIGGGCDLFAFPFGHANGYLVHDYLPSRVGEHRMKAAFGTGGRPVRADDTPWNIPRLVCGHHWKSPEEFDAVLRG